MTRTVIALLLLVTAASAQQLAPLEQRLGATIGALIVENNRLAIALDEANKTIAQLRMELDKVNK
jgi:hypothetical protein